MRTELSRDEKMQWRTKIILLKYSNSELTFLTEALLNIKIKYNFTIFWNERRRSELTLGLIASVPRTRCYCNLHLRFPFVLIYSLSTHVMISLTRPVNKEHYVPCSRPTIRHCPMSHNLCTSHSVSGYPRSDLVPLRALRADFLVLFVVLSQTLTISLIIWRVLPKGRRNRLGMRSGRSFLRAYV